MPRKRLTALTLAFAAGLAGPAFGQDLATVYESARTYDASYLAARALAESAQYRVAQSQALARPSLNAKASATTTVYSSDTVGGAGSPGGEGTSLRGALQAQYALVNRVNDATIDRDRKSLGVASADLASAEQDLVLRVATAYFDVLAAQDALATARASQAAVREQLASAKRNFEVGTATITDAREAQARFDLARAQEIAAENELRTSRVALDQLVGRVGVEPRPLATPVRLPPVLPADPDPWLRTAEAQHPAIARAQALLAVAQAEIDRARAQGAPALDLVGSLDIGRASGRYPSGPPGTTPSASIGLQLSMPLYTGGAIDSRVSEAALLAEKARNDLAAARRGVEQATRSALLDVQSGTAQVAALEAAEASSKLALEATQLGYEVGVRVNLDVLNAQSQLDQTRRDLARARYDVLLGALRLRQAAGTLSGADLAPINSLLAP